MPVCCSTVTPGKLATFWRSPVRRLKRVVFPEFGGPMSATALGAVLDRGSSMTAAEPHELQSLHPLTGSSGRRAPDLQSSRSLAAQRNFGPIHLKNSRVAARSRSAGGNRGSREESQLHQAPRVLTRKIDAVQHRTIAPLEIHQRGGEAVGRDAIDTQLHLGFSMPKSEILVKRLPALLLIFTTTHLRRASKYRKM